MHLANHQAAWNSRKVSKTVRKKGWKEERKKEYKHVDKEMVRMNVVYKNKSFFFTSDTIGYIYVQWNLHMNYNMIEIYGIILYFFILFWGFSSFGIYCNCSSFCCISVFSKFLVFESCCCLYFGHLFHLLVDEKLAWYFPKNVNGTDLLIWIKTISTWNQVFKDPKFNQSWNLISNQGAAFGFTTIAAQAGEQLAPYLPKIVPRLYRYQFDPNPKIQMAMSSIWQALVSDNKKTVRQNFCCYFSPRRKDSLLLIIINNAYEHIFI